MEKYPFIRAIYLYLFALIGLTLIVIGSVGMVNLGLRSFIFTKADDEDRLMYNEPSYPPIPVNEIDKIAGETGEKLTESEITAIKKWLADYEGWQDLKSKRDYVGARRSREASQNIAMIIIGVPLYLYHWGTIKRDRKEKNDERKQ